MAMVTHQFVMQLQLSYFKDICLNSVDLTVEVIDRIFSSCLLVEVLMINGSSSLLQVTVPGSLLQLKYLEILSCNSLKSIEIGARNLVSFKYRGPALTISFQEVPFLIEASFMGPCTRYLVSNVHSHTLLLSQLVKLTLDYNNFASCMKLPKFPKLRKLKHLDLVLARWTGLYCLSSIFVTKAFPMLDKFSLQVAGPEKIPSKWKARAEKWMSLRRVYPYKEKHLHKRLKVFEFIGFSPYKTDMELALWVIGNTRALERIIIDPYFPYCIIDVVSPEKKSIARACAELLRKRVSDGTELVILARNNHPKS